MGTRENEEVDALVTEILADYDKGRDIDKTDFYDRPEREEVRKITDSLLKIMYPGYYRDRTFKSYNAYGNLTESPCRHRHRSHLRRGPGRLQ